MNGLGGHVLTLKRPREASDSPTSWACPQEGRFLVEGKHLENQEVETESWEEASGPGPCLVNSVALGPAALGTAVGLPNCGVSPWLVQVMKLSTASDCSDAR